MTTIMVTMYIRARGLLGVVTHVMCMWCSAVLVNLLARDNRHGSEDVGRQSCCQALHVLLKAMVTGAQCIQQTT